MKYQDRTRTIGAWLQQELKRYDVPANHTPERARQEMDAMVEDINSEIPSSVEQSSLDHILSKMSQDIRKNTRSRSWPTIYTLTKAAQKCSETQATAITGPRQPYVFDSDAISARRINAGEAVAETYVTGSGADRLIEKGLVTAEQLEPYKKYLREERMKLYGNPEPVQYTEHDQVPELEENPY
jgi:glutamate synthase domain-containing protein 1